MTRHWKKSEVRQHNERYKAQEKQVKFEALAESCGLCPVALGNYSEAKEKMLLKIGGLARGKNNGT